MGAAVQQPSGGNGRRRGRRRGRAQPMAEINVTPFVDVMLVLLIIFMVAAPLLTVGVPVDLPKTAASALPGDNEEPLTVTLTADGRVQIQTTDVVREELIGKLRAIAAERTSDRVFLRADGAIPYAQVMQVMGALNAGGFSNVGLVTDTGGPDSGRRGEVRSRGGYRHQDLGNCHVTLIGWALFGGTFRSEPLADGRAGRVGDHRLSNSPAMTAQRDAPEVPVTPAAMQQPEAEPDAVANAPEHPIEEEQQRPDPVAPTEPEPEPLNRKPLKRHPILR